VADIAIPVLAFLALFTALSIFTAFRPEIVNDLVFRLASVFYGERVTNRYMIRALRSTGIIMAVAAIALGCVVVVAIL